jgi:hypothetical protein
VEKLFYLRPGANLGKVRVELRGANHLRLSQEGELVIETGLGELKLSKPVAWQEKDGQKLPVQTSYRVFGKNRYGFAVQGADPSLPLVIDPILQATYLGGSSDDEATALTIAGNGEVVVAGATSSNNFPNTGGGAQAGYGGYTWDAFVARLSVDLKACPKGDVNGDCAVTVQDVFYLTTFLFASGSAPVGSGDVNGDSQVSVQDVFYLINYLFAGGPAPV